VGIMGTVRTLVLLGSARSWTDAAAPPCEDSSGTEVGSLSENGM